VRAHLARVHAMAEYLALRNWEIVSTDSAAPTRIAASATKVYGTETACEAYRLLMEVLGSSGYQRSHSPTAALHGRLERLHRSAAAPTRCSATSSPRPASGSRRRRAWPPRPPPHPPTGKWADMDFLVDDTTTELTGLVRDMGERLVTDESLRELDARFGPGAESGGTDRSTARVHSRFWEELVRAGVPAALGPESLGGAGLGVVGEALVMRELGRVLAPVPLSPAIRGAW